MYIRWSQQQRYRYPGPVEHVDDVMSEVIKSTMWVILILDIQTNAEYLMKICSYSYSELFTFSQHNCDYIFMNVMVSVCVCVCVCLSDYRDKRMIYQYPWTILSCISLWQFCIVIFSTKHFYIHTIFFLYLSNILHMQNIQITPTDNWYFFTCKFVIPYVFSTWENKNVF